MNITKPNLCCYCNYKMTTVDGNVDSLATCYRVFYTIKIMNMKQDASTHHPSIFQRVTQMRGRTRPLLVVKKLTSRAIHSVLLLRTLLLLGQFNTRWMMMMMDDGDDA